MKEEFNLSEKIEKYKGSINGEGEVSKMREKERIKRILKLIEDKWNKKPDMRFGQLIMNLGIFEDLFKFWNNEDDGLEEYLKEFKKW